MAHVLRFSPKELSSFEGDFFAASEFVESERGDTFELQNVLLVTDHPLDRVATEKWRKMNVGFAITEALQMIVGDDAVGPIAQFIPSYTQFSTNGRTIDGAYGPRAHLIGQYDRLLQMLRNDTKSRRAVLNLYMGPTDLLGGGGTNTPCTLNLHFLVRDGALDLTVMMRSNDVRRGLTNDIFVFTMFQEWTAIRLGIPLGKYTHFTTSLHLYSDDVVPHPLFADPSTKISMNAMPRSFNPDRLYKSICDLPTKDASDCNFEADLLSTRTYERDLYLAAAAIAKRKLLGATRLCSKIEDPILRMVTSYWMTTEE